MTRSRSSGLSRVLGYAVAGQIVYLLSQFGVLSAISHFRGPEAVGMFGLAIALTTPVFIFANSGLRLSQSIDQGGQFSFGEYAAFRLRLTALAFVVSLVLGFASTGDPVVRTIILLVAAAKVFEGATELSYGMFEARGRTDLMFRSLVSRGILTLACFVGLILLNAPIQYAFASQLLIWGAVAIFIDLPASKRLSGTRYRDMVMSWSRFRELFKTVFPVGLGAFLRGLQPSLLRLLVGAFLGIYTLGIYTNIYYVFHSGSILSNVLGNSITARFAKLGAIGQIAQQNRQAIVIALVLGIACMFGIVFTWIFAGWFLGLAFGPETAQHADLLVVMAVALTARFLSTVSNSLHYARGGAKTVLAIEFSLVVSILIAGVLLIPLYGLIGAGLALLVASAMRLIIGSVAAWRAAPMAALAGAQKAN